ncbi:hypothetical protein RHSIM_Rhsim02G0134500 [Rhododendron simsii]|uniref:Aminotransferase-like plant mobile domain-containing protein n=1 Tax=Rhododendron simsii TaxID=118357 RepID=A0A834HLN6_RHOSS|nr:hypothetical protein RHSIM_Rhsim02G0134500 [Rhododendron simsii]
MVRDDVEQGSKAILQTSIRAHPADEWRRAPYFGGSSDSFWRKAEAFIPEAEISKDPLSLAPEAPAHWSDWVESVLNNPDFVHTLKASQALEPIRLSTELSIRKNNTNIDLMVSRWSKDTHTFVFPWGDGGPTLQDTAVWMRLSTRGSVALDPSNLSPTDARLVERLRRAYTEAGKYGSRSDREGRVRAPPKSGKTSWGCWLRYFFKDLPPPGTTPPTGQASEFYGKMYDSDLHLAGFLVYWLSFFVIPDFPGGEEPRPLIMRWSGVSSTKSWGKRIDDADTFFPRPYAESIEGALPTSFFSENDRIVDFQTSGVTVSASALAAFAAACPCSLPALCAEGIRSMLYRPDKIARQFGYDQGAPGQVPPLRSYVESLRRFTRAFVGELTEGFNVVVLSRNDREAFFTANSRLAWRRNLDSFSNYVRGNSEIPALSDVYHRDVSLRSPKARQPGWHGLLATARPSTEAAMKGKPSEQHFFISSWWYSLFASVAVPEPISSFRVPHSSSKDPPLGRDPCERRVASAGSSFRREGGEHTPSSKLKRKREDEESRKEGSDSSIDDTAPISQSFKLPRAAQPSLGGEPAVEGKKVVADQAEGESSGTASDAEDSDDRHSEEVVDSDAEGSGDDENGDDENCGGDDNSDEDLGDDEEGGGAEDENDGDGTGNGGNEDEGRDGVGENLGVDTAHPAIEEDEEDDEGAGLIPRRRVPTEGFLTVPDINQLAPEAVPPPLVRPDAVKSAFDLFHRRVNVPPADDLATHFQAHNATVALTNLTSAEVFADLQDDSLISLGTPQVGYVAGNFGEGSSSIAGGATLQQHAEASISHGQEAIEDDSDVRVVEPPVTNEEEEVLSNEAFFGQFRLTRDETSFLSFTRDRFSYTFSKVRGLYSLTMGQMQLQCLHHFLLSIKDIRVCDLDLSQIEEIGQTVQNFDKLGFDIWWVYKELDAAKIMRENDKLWRHCEGAKAALGEAQAALAKARDAVAVAEAVVEERRLVYERMAEEARLGDRLIDVPLCDTDPFLKKVLG